MLFPFSCFSAFIFSIMMFFLFLCCNTDTCCVWQALCYDECFWVALVNMDTPGQRRRQSSRASRRWNWLSQTPGSQPLCLPRLWTCLGVGLGFLNKGSPASSFLTYLIILKNKLLFTGEAELHSSGHLLLLSRGAFLFLEQCTGKVN